MKNLLNCIMIQPPVKAGYSYWFIGFLASCLSVACVKKPDQLAVPVAAPLEEKETDMLSSKRGYSSLLQQLYEDTLSKSEALKQLEKNYNDLDEKIAAPVTEWQTYNSKSVDYYNFAESALSQVKDSLLRVYVKSILDSSKSRYKTMTGQFTALESRINGNTADLNDYHNSLKVLVTLPLIEQFQQNRIPTKEGLMNAEKAQNKVLDELKSNIGK